MRLGGRKRARDLGDGRRLFVALATAIRPLELGQRMALARALGDDWADLEPWMRELFAQIAGGLEEEP